MDKVATSFAYSALGMGIALCLICLVVRYQQRPPRH